MSMPFRDKEFTFTQPDGSRFKVRGTGNQHNAVFQTPEGYAVVEDPSSGFYHFAEVGEAGETIKPVPVRPGAVDPARLGLTRHPFLESRVVRESVFTTGLPRTPSRRAVISGPRAIASVQLKQEICVFTGFSGSGIRSMVMV